MKADTHELSTRMMEPASWVEHADSLKLAADVLFEHMQTIARSTTPRSVLRVQMLGIVRGYMTLLGASFENLLKAIAVSRGLLAPSSTEVKFDRSFRGADTHALVHMAESLPLALSNPEIDLLSRTSEYLAWAGRYPVARKLGRSASALSGGVLRVSGADRILARSLMSRLRNHIIDPD